MKARNSLGVMVCVLAAVFLALPSTHARITYYDAGGKPVSGPVTMQQLLSGYYIQVDDKIFDNWRAYSSVATGGASPVPASAVFVSGIIGNGVPGNTDAGVAYQSALWAVGPGQSQDTKWEYDVYVGGGAPYLIRDNSMRLVGYAVVGAGAYILIAEVPTSNGQPLVDINDPTKTSKLVRAGALGIQVFDQMFFQPVSSVHIAKDLALYGGTGVAFVSDFQQNFSQMPTTAVPEPGTLALIGVGVGMIGLMAWRRRNSED